MSAWQRICCWQAVDPNKQSLLIMTNKMWWSSREKAVFLCHGRDKEKIVDYWNYLSKSKPSKKMQWKIEHLGWKSWKGAEETSTNSIKNQPDDMLSDTIGQEAFNAELFDKWCMIFSFCQSHSIFLNNPQQLFTRNALICICVYHMENCFHLFFA